MKCRNTHRRSIRTVSTLKPTFLARFGQLQSPLLQWLAMTSGLIRPNPDRFYLSRQPDQSPLHISTNQTKIMKTKSNLVTLLASAALGAAAILTIAAAQTETFS